MKRLLKFGLFESKSDGFPTDRKEIARICRKYGIKNYSIGEDGTVDVDDIVDLSKKRLDRLPLRFGNVSGYFDCGNNLLTSLEGAPEVVGGSFFCHNNRLTSLEGGPRSVGNVFYCYDNQLTSLVGSPDMVNGNFLCQNNRLTSLVGAPKEVGGCFFCQVNCLTSLEGAPERVVSSFDCRNNRLTNLVGAPKEVGRGFDCRDNRLINLVGVPKSEFVCEEKFKILIDQFGGIDNFRLSPGLRLPVGLFPTYQLFLDSLDACNWIDGDTIYRSRLEDAIEVFGIKGSPIPDKIEGYVIK